MHTAVEGVVYVDVIFKVGDLLGIVKFRPYKGMDHPAGEGSHVGAFTIPVVGSDQFVDTGASHGSERPSGVGGSPNRSEPRIVGIDAFGLFLSLDAPNKE
jgi:hypothetical protein